MKDNFEEKYIDLLLKRCLNFDKSSILFISYDVVNKDFVDKVIKKAKEMGIEEIICDQNDIYEFKDKLDKISIDDIEKDPYFDKSNWNTYALKSASFLIFATEFPKVLDGLDNDKLSKARKVMRESRKIFREKESLYEIPWCIAALPNELWAKDIFPNDNDSYQKLFEVICKMCMVDTENPIESWNKYIENNKYLVSKLNDLKITHLHYTNSLGTDLTIGLTNDCLWEGVGTDFEKDMLANMPSYEIFTTPDYRKTEGIVYSSKPLMYGGGLIDHFYLKFKDGKVCEYKAEVGEHLLKEIIESDNNSCYLGECALVNFNSPISNTGLVFGTTLFDENAACHLALGDGFPTCYKDGIHMSRDELLKRGINHSSTHVDFMIGTSDLKIVAQTKKGEVILFENGNFVI